MGVALWYNPRVSFASFPPGHIYMFASTCLSGCLIVVAQTMLLQPSRDRLNMYIKVLEDPSKSDVLKIVACNDLGEMREEAAPAVPAILAAAAERRELLHSVVRVIPRIGAAAIPALREGLKHRKVEVRIAAVHGIFALVGRRREATPLMAQALRDENKKVAEAASRRLETLGVEALPTLLEISRDVDPGVPVKLSRASIVSVVARIVTYSHSCPAWSWPLTTRRLQYERKPPLLSVLLARSDPKPECPPLALSFRANQGV